MGKAVIDNMKGRLPMVFKKLYILEQNVRKYKGLFLD
jgi:hypothetical protein